VENGEVKVVNEEEGGALTDKATAENTFKSL